MKYNSQYFYQHVIPDIHIKQNICSSSRRKTLKDIQFSCILTMDQLTIRDFLEKRLNPQKPKECRIHLITQTRPSTKSILPLRLSERKLRGASPTPSDDLIFAIWHFFPEIPEMGLKNLLTNWIMRLSWAMKKRGECCRKS
jgi:hypothetical protein